jgi:probable rRNA maturation factor
MKALNQRFLKRDHTTDVLAFDLGEDLILSAERPILKKKERRLQGEIIISATTAAANARRFATSVDYELILYVVHGILHLLGYDDHRPTDRKRMRSKEQEMMAILKWVGR